MEKAILVGANGNLGPIWARSILDTGSKLICLGREKQPEQNLQSLSMKFSESISYYELAVYFK
jgi:hypothetical protein